MILGFKDRFIPYITEGTKTHTIRAGNRWRAGMRADLYARPRQKGMTLLFRTPVVKVEEVTIWLRKPAAKLYADEPCHAGALGIAINTEILSDDEANALAYRDGFRERPLVQGGHLDALAEMARFWLAEHGSEDGLPIFRGQLIHWDFARRFTDLRHACYQISEALACNKSERRTA